MLVGITHKGRKTDAGTLEHAKEYRYLLCQRCSRVFSVGREEGKRTKSVHKRCFYWKKKIERILQRKSFFFSLAFFVPVCCLTKSHSLRSLFLKTCERWLLASLRSDHRSFRENTFPNSEDVLLHNSTLPILRSSLLFEQNSLTNILNQAKFTKKGFISL